MKSIEWLILSLIEEIYLVSEFCHEAIDTGLTCFSYLDDLSIYECGILVWWFESVVLIRGTVYDFCLFHS